MIKVLIRNSRKPRFVNVGIGYRGKPARKPQARIIIDPRGPDEEALRFVSENQDPSFAEDTRPLIQD